jgi:acyl-CoA-binding protein
MFCVKTLTQEDGSVLFEVNRMYSLDSYEPLKTFTTQEDAHNHVLKLIDEFKKTLADNSSNQT